MSEFRWGAAPEPKLPSVPGYTILSSLGAGGMGAVYRAQDSALGREVALKLTPRRLMREDAAARFQQEAELLARFRHPGVLQVHTWGETPEWLYLVCELVEEAQTFDEACAGREASEHLALAQRVCETLSALHAAGVVHRDVKPDNVLVTPTGEVKLVDFGIAAAEEAQRLTLSGAFVGTALYAAPERIRLEGQRVDPAADVWSAAAMFYEVLTGRLPFEASTYAGIVAASEAPPPSVAELRDDLSPGVIAAIDRALSLDPAARPTAAELARGLSGERPAQSAGRRALLALTACLALGGGVLGAALLASQAGAPSVATPSRSAPPRHPGARALAERDRAAAARLVRPLLIEGEEGRLVAELGEEATVELCALGLLPPLPHAKAPLPAEWVSLSERLGPGRPHLVEAVRGALRSAPWREIKAALAAGRQAEPAAPWWALEGLLAFELAIPSEPMPESLPERAGPWALRDWKVYLEDLRRSDQRSRGMVELAERTSDPLLRDLVRARAAAEAVELPPEASELSARYGRLRIRAEVLERFSEEDPAPLGVVSALDEASPGAVRLYVDFLVIRSQWVMRTFESRPTPLGFRIARRFAELSLEEVESSPRFRHELLKGLTLRFPSSRAYAKAEAEASAERWPSYASQFRALAALTRGLPPGPADLALPPEWQARVAALDPAARPGVRRAVELGICGRSWHLLEEELARAREASSDKEGVAVARALLALARSTGGVLSLDEACRGLPKSWETLVRSRWSRTGGRPPEWLAPLGLEYELDVARYPTPDLERLRELAPRHSEAAIALAHGELPDRLRPDLFEVFLERLDPILEKTGTLYVEGLLRRTPAAWNWAQDAGGTGTGVQVLEHTLHLAPDGPGLVLAWRDILPPKVWQEQLISRARDWPRSGHAHGMAGCVLLLRNPKQPPSAEALGFLDDARKLGWRPRGQVLELMRELFPDVIAEYFGD